MSLNMRRQDMLIPILRLSSIEYIPSGPWHEFSELSYYLNHGPLQ